MTPSVPHLVAGLDWERIEDDVIIFDGSMLHRLAGAAALIFLEIDGFRATHQIIDQTAARRSVDPAVVERDVLQVVEDLLRRGLVTMALPALGAVFVKPSQVGYVLTHDGILAADLVSGARHLLEPPASDVWTALLETGTIDGALETLETRYGRDPSLRDDVDRLVDELVELGLLTTCA